MWWMTWKRSVIVVIFLIWSRYLYENETFFRDSVRCRRRSSRSSGRVRPASWCFLMPTSNSTPPTSGTRASLSSDTEPLCTEARWIKRRHCFVYTEPGLFPLQNVAAALVNTEDIDHSYCRSSSIISTLPSSSLCRQRSCRARCWVTGPSPQIITSSPWRMETLS